MYKIVDVSFAQNSYILTEKNKAIIIDPGFNSKKIINKITELNLKPIAILLTHYHFDHVQGVDILADKYKILAYIHESDKPFLLKDTLAIPFGFNEVNVQEQNIKTFVTDLKFDDFIIEPINVKGHSPGSTCYKYKNHIFTGDFLFLDSIGRTDLPGSEPQEMHKSLQTIKTWSPKIDIEPGHGPSAKLEAIIKNNLFLK